MTDSELSFAQRHVQIDALSSSLFLMVIPLLANQYLTPALCSAMLLQVLINSY